MTSYDTVYNNFTSKITDYKIFDLSDTDIEEMFYGFLISSITKFKPITTNLTKRDDTLKTFTVDLLDVEIEILGCLMVVEWITPQLNSTTNTHQMFANDKEKFYAQSNQIDALRNMKKDMKSEARKLRRDYVTDNSDYLHKTS